MQESLFGSSMQSLVFIIGPVIGAGIWLTGFSTVHWLLYLTPFLFSSAAITVIGPEMIISHLILGAKSTKQIRRD